MVLGGIYVASMAHAAGTKQTRKVVVPTMLSSRPERDREQKRERSGAWGVRGRGRGRGETSTVPPVRLRSLESRSPEMMIAMPVFCLGFVSPPPPNDTRHYASNQRRCRSLLRHPGS